MLVLGWVNTWEHFRFKCLRGRFKTSSVLHKLKKQKKTEADLRANDVLKDTEWRFCSHVFK